MTTQASSTFGRLPKVAAVLLVLAALALLATQLGHSAPLPQRAEGELQASNETAIEANGLAAMTLGENARILGRDEAALAGNEAIPFAAGSISPVASFTAISASSPEYADALQCLNQAIYYEAALEPESGKRAVAQVVLNRLRHPAYPSSVCGVVYEGWNKPICQFSFVCDGSLTRQPVAGLWQESRQVARDALAGRVEPTVGTATHYHADYVLPRWASTLDKLERHGRHLFYSFPGSAGRIASFNANWTGREAIPQIDFSRFAGLDLSDSDNLVDQEEPRDWLEVDPTDRRTANDVGGRMDPSKQWRLTIPDPVQASSTYNASLETQGDAAIGEDAL